METPAPAERMAALEARLLPGNESRMDWAFFFGSSWGTLELDRDAVSWVVMEGSVRGEKVGRSRAAPVVCQWDANGSINGIGEDGRTDGAFCESRSHCFGGVGRCARGEVLRLRLRKSSGVRLLDERQAGKSRENIS
jgi:hypothetical protein